MIENGKQVNFKFNFGTPSCVPATTLETAGAEINAAEIQYLLEKPEIKYLGEMMNWLEVLFNDPVVYEKLNIAKALGKPIDGHAPRLRGEQAEQYIKAGISTDHECFTAQEARDKLKQEMKIAIREGSAAKNFEALVELFDVVRAACITPVEHYSLDVSTLREGDFADFIVTNDIEQFTIYKTFINGALVAEAGESNIAPVQIESINSFDCSPIPSEAINVKAKGDRMNVIEALDGQLITNTIVDDVKKDKGGYLILNLDEDHLKFVVVNRYEDAKPAVGFIKSFNLKEGAIASSVGHDSHNILAVGVDDENITKAINLIIASKGGVSAVGKGLYLH